MAATMPVVSCTTAHGAGLLQFAVGRKAPATPMQSSPLAMAPATSWARSPTITACWVAEVRQGSGDDAGLPDADRPLRGLVCGGTPDGLEQPGDAVVLQHDLRQAFRLLGGHGDRPPCAAKPSSTSLIPGYRRLWAMPVAR